MKSRRIAIVAFLLLACMVIGIGYASLTRELNVSGTLHAGTRSNLEVWFVGAEKDTSVDNNYCSVAALSGGTEKALTVNMETDQMLNVGDKAVAKFEIANQELIANATHAELVTPSFTLTASNAAFTNPEDFYTVTYEFVEVDDNPTGDGEEVTIAGDSKSVTDLPPQHAVYLIVTVTLTQSVIDASVSHAATFTITYTANAIAAH